jgi:DNA polymerase-3 subunit gamma/tau
MMNVIQQTVAGFTRSTSRRMDAELCVINLCMPELSLDPESLNVRLTRVEEQIKSGSYTVTNSQPNYEDVPPAPDDRDVPPEYLTPEPVTVADPQPAGFWVDMVSEIRKELKPPASGFFVSTPNAPVEGILRENRLELICSAAFIVDVINKPDILDMISRKASAKLGRKIRAVAVDKTAANLKTKQMEQLLRFGQEHSDIIKIK